METIKRGLESAKKEVDSIGLEKPPWLQALQSGEAFKAPEMPAFKAPEIPKLSMPSVPLPQPSVQEEVAAAPEATPKPAAVEPPAFKAPEMPAFKAPEMPAFKAPEMPAFSMPSFSMPEMPAAAPAKPKPKPKPVPAPKPPPPPPPPAPTPLSAFFDSLFGGKGAAPSSGARARPKGPVIAEPADTFDDDLSAWPAILQIKDSLEEMPPAEQRRQRLEVGTNWPPRTTTAMVGEREGPLAFFDFDDTGREGYMFFQGPTPKTGVQPDLAPLLSKEDLANTKVSPKLFVAGGVALPSFAYVLYLLLAEA